MDKKSVAGGVLGMIGAVFALIGAFVLSICAAAADVISGGVVNYVWAAYVFGFGAAFIALAGAVFAFKKALISGILQAVAVVFIIILSIIMSFAWANIVALILLIIGTILSFCVTKPVE